MWGLGVSWGLSTGGRVEGGALHCFICMWHDDDDDDDGGKWEMGNGKWEMAFTVRHGTHSSYILTNTTYSETSQTLPVSWLM